MATTAHSHHDLTMRLRSIIVASRRGGLAFLLLRPLGHLETSVRSEAMLTWNGTRGDPRSENRGRPATGSNAPPRRVVPVVGNTSPPANLSSAYSQLVGACGHAGVTRLAWISYTDGRNRPMYGRSR